MSASPDFAHLHLHTQFSLLDGANRLGDVIHAAKAADMPAIALTDHGNMFGAIEFYERARAAGIKPILGIEAYVAQGDHTDKDPRRASSNHLVLLARNETGFRNLIKLTSRSFLEGFYYRPRIDHRLLEQHSEGLIGLSACLKGEVSELITSGHEKQAEARANRYREILGDGNFYLELQDHGIEEQRLANEVLRRISQRSGIPLVATNDCHYLRQSDSFAHDVLLCVGTQRTLEDPDRLRYASDQFYLKSADEMFALFPDEAAAIENTVAIAERCNLELDTDTFYLPDFPVPEGYTLSSYLEKVARDGLDRRLEQLRAQGSRALRELGPDVYRERLRTELEIIKQMGFPGYFLIVWDFIRYAREHRIPVGPGRGSGAGSLAAYSLGITDIDPLEYDLLFERFLNPNRISLPDFDIDFCMRRRGEVIQYVSEKYGRDRVAQIITFGTLAAKAVIRDVGRVMGVPYGKVDRIAKMIPDMTRSLADAAREVPELASEVNSDPEVRKIVEVGSQLEGLTRHASLHAAGVVITPQPIDELVPLYKTSKDEIVTQWDMKVVEKLGLLKMDFLGLRTLTVIDDTLRALEHQGVQLDLDTIPLDDEATFKLFCDGRTSGVFQFESTGMTDLLRRAQPSRFEDLAALNALFRPGALSVGMVEEYIHRKSGRRKIRYILPETEPILRETYGVIAYQEQVMQIAVEIAGFSMGDADVLRAAMGKKKAAIMAEQKSKFIDGGEAKGFPRRKVEELWEYIEPFAGYGFNKSHSVAYAQLAYRTAYLKAHYPVPFMASMLTSEMSTKDNVSKYIRECREMRIPVLPPDVNESNWSFTAVGDTIRFGLGAVKGVGGAAVEAILEARHRVGSFKGLVNLACEVDPKAINHRVFDALVKSGAFDSFDMPRHDLHASLARVLDYAQKRRRDSDAGQSTLFGASAAPDTSLLTTGDPWSERERLASEKEALGFYLTGNPLSEHESEIRRLTTHRIGELEGGEDRVVVGGVVSAVRRVKIKSGANAGRFMGRFVLEDLEGSISVAVFADKLERYGALLVDEAVVLVKGAVRERGAEKEIAAEEIASLESAAAELRGEVDLILAREMSTAEALRLRDLLTERPGPIRVFFRLELPGKKPVRVVPEDRFQIALDDAMTTAIEEILGHGAVRRRARQRAG